MPAVRAIAAAALLVLAGGLREFGIGGGPILCVPAAEIDPDATPYAPDPKHLQPGAPAFAFRFSAEEIRRRVPAFAVDPELAGLRSASMLDGSLSFPDETAAPRGPGVTCRHETLRYGAAAGKAFGLCVRTALIDGVVVQYDVQEENVPLVPALDVFLDHKIAEWRDNCHATDRM